MFTKCLWGGQSDLTIKEIIESGKYDIKGYSYTHSDLNSGYNSTIINTKKQGFLLQISVYAYYQVDFDITMISSGKTKNISVEGIYNKDYSERRASARFNFQNILDNKIYVFEPYNNTANVKISDYTYPESTKENIYIVPTNYPITIESLPSDISYNSELEYGEFVYYSNSTSFNTLKPLQFNEMNLSFNCTKLYRNQTTNPYIKVVWAELK